MIIVWITVGILIGMALATIVISIYGDTELNQHIHELRQARYDLQLARTRYRLAHTFNWWKRQKIVKSAHQSDTERKPTE